MRFFTFSQRFQSNDLPKEVHPQISSDSRETNDIKLKINRYLLVPQNGLQTNKVSEHSLMEINLICFCDLASAVTTSFELLNCLYFSLGQRKEPF